MRCWPGSSAFRCCAGPRRPSGTLVGQAAPALDAPDLEGRDWSLADADGRITWVNFWATSCEPCRTEMPAMQRIAEEYADELLVLGVNWGEEDTAVAGFADRYGVTYPILLDPGLDIYYDWAGTDGLRHYFIGESGTVLREVIGPLDPARMVQIVEGSHRKLNAGRGALSARPVIGLALDDHRTVHVRVDVALEVVRAWLERGHVHGDGLTGLGRVAEHDLVAALLAVDADVVRRRVVVDEGDREVLAAASMVVASNARSAAVISMAPSVTVAVPPPPLPSVRLAGVVAAAAGEGGDDDDGEGDERAAAQREQGEVHS